MAEPARLMYDKPLDGGSAGSCGAATSPSPVAAASPPSSSSPGAADAPSSLTPSSSRGPPSDPRDASSSSGGSCRCPVLLLLAAAPAPERRCDQLQRQKGQMQCHLGVMHVAVVQQVYGEADRELLARARRPELAEAEPADGGRIVASPLSLQVLGDRREDGPIPGRCRGESSAEVSGYHI